MSVATARLKRTKLDPRPVQRQHLPSVAMRHVHRWLVGVMHAGVHEDLQIRDRWCMLRLVNVQDPRAAGVNRRRGIMHSTWTTEPVPLYAVCPSSSSMTVKLHSPIIVRLNV